MSALIPAGIYRVKAIQGQHHEATTKGTPGVNVVFEVLDEGPHKGARVLWEAWLSDAAAARTIQQLRTAGVTLDPSLPDEELDRRFGSLEGLGSRECELQVEVEQFLPAATETNPTPVAIKKSRGTWVRSPATSFHRALATEEATKRAKGLRATIRAALAGRGSAATADADGNHVDDGGALRNKGGRQIF